MHNYLPQIEATYSGETLTLKPSNQVQTSGVFLQSVSETDGGNPKTVTMKTVPDYIIPLSFNGLKESDRNILFDLYHNPIKAMGSARSFLWEHPSTAAVYVVRFEGG